MYKRVITHKTPRFTRGDKGSFTEFIVHALVLIIVLFFGVGVLTLLAVLFS